MAEIDILDQEEATVMREKRNREADKTPCGYVKNFFYCLIKFILQFQKLVGHATVIFAVAGTMFSVEQSTDERYTAFLYAIGVGFITAFIIEIVLSRCHCNKLVKIDREVDLPTTGSFVLMVFLLAVVIAGTIQIDNKCIKQEGICNLKDVFIPS